MAETGLGNLIDLYGATPADIEDSNFAIKELTLQENEKVIKVQFYEPLVKDIMFFGSLYEQSL